jgi:hypothetical protein
MDIFVGVRHLIKFSGHFKPIYFGLLIAANILYLPINFTRRKRMG